MRVAYMPQTFGCNAFLSVFESVLLALKQSSGWRVKANDIAQVEKTLSDLGLSHLSGRGLSQLSGGQAQMVAVARTRTCAVRRANQCLRLTPSIVNHDTC